MAQPHARQRRLGYEALLFHDRHDPLGTQDLRVAAELLQAARKDEGPVRHERGELRVLPQTTEASSRRRRVRLAVCESVRATAARGARQTHLDDGWRRSD